MVITAADGTAGVVFPLSAVWIHQILNHDLRRLKRSLLLVKNHGDVGHSKYLLVIEAGPGRMMGGVQR